MCFNADTFILRFSVDVWHSFGFAERLTHARYLPPLLVGRTRTGPRSGEIFRRVSAGLRETRDGVNPTEMSEDKLRSHLSGRFLSETVLHRELCAMPERCMVSSRKREEDAPDSRSAVLYSGPLSAVSV